MGNTNALPEMLQVWSEPNSHDPERVGVMRHESGRLTLSASSTGHTATLHLSTDFARRIAGIMVAQADAADGERTATAGEAA